MKLIKKRGKDINKMAKLVYILSEERPLPSRCKNHRLKGEWNGTLEFHIEPDWILIYEIINKDIYLKRTGSHSDLF